MTHGFTGFFAGLCQFVLGLEIEPELWIDAEPVSETERGLAGDGAFAGDDLTDPVWRHVDLPSELGRGDVQFSQFVLEDGTWVNGSHKHGRMPFFSGNRQFQLRMALPVRPATRSTTAIAG